MRQLAGSPRTPPSLAAADHGSSGLPLSGSSRRGAFVWAAPKHRTEEAGGVCPIAGKNEPTELVAGGRHGRGLNESLLPLMSLVLF